MDGGSVTSMWLRRDAAVGWHCKGASDPVVTFRHHPDMNDVLGKSCYQQGQFVVLALICFDLFWLIVSVNYYKQPTELGKILLCCSK